jgi:drug/metabolite transporter (DMT)-like permease
VFVWLGAAGALTVYAVPALVQVVVGSRAPSWAGVGFAAGSGALHAVYFTALQRAYREGDLGVVYPLARGTGPALSVLAAVLVLGERPGPIALLGAALVVLAVLSLAAGGGARPSAAALGFALGTGATIAVYTLWDAHAVGALKQPEIAYFWLTTVFELAVLAPWALRGRGRLRATWARDRVAVAGVATLSPLAYILVLFALTIAPVSLVAPGREASIVIASLLGARVLGEGDRRRRLGAAAVILVGIACLAAG